MITKLTRIVYTDNSISYKARGVCGLQLNYIPESQHPIYCWNGIKYEINRPGYIPECVKCLTGVCSELRGNTFDTYYQAANEPAIEVGRDM